MRGAGRCLANGFGFVLLLFMLTEAVEPVKEEVDNIIEDEITHKLSEDLLQSIERKFHADLEKSVGMVLAKIKLLLQNGTMHIQDRLLELQGQLDTMKKHDEKEVENCLMEKQTETSALAEKALHQMVVCGYALIGHDPAQAVKSVIDLKNMIKQELQPVYRQKKEVHDLLKACGHNHDTLKKVIKCVIAKSPIVKTSMMTVTGKLLNGIVDLTKVMAHGAMHEACLIEVVKTVQDEAFELVENVRFCVNGNNTIVKELNNYIEANNATVLDIKSKKVKDASNTTDSGKVAMNDMKDLIRRMWSSKNKELDKKFKMKLMKLHEQLPGGDNNNSDEKMKLE